MTSFSYPMSGLSAEPEPGDPAILTIDRIFGSKDFEVKRYSARWIEGQNAFTTLIDSPNDHQRKVLQRIDAATGEEEVILTPQDLIPSGAESPLTIDGYALSEDQSTVLVYSNSQRVWRQNTRGDYWLFDRSAKALTKLGGDGKPASMMFAKLSPAGDQVAFVRNNNIYVEELSNHSIRALTTTGDGEVVNGTSDWVYEEEFQVRDGFQWSPDGKHIAYWQIDTTGVGKFPLVNNIDSLYPEVQWFAYPKVGQNNPTCRVGVVDVATGETQWVNLPGDRRDFYIPRMQWAESSNELMIQQMNRLQNRNQLYLADVNAGSVSPVLTEQDDAWVDVHHELFWLSGRKYFTWISERDGWRHVYLSSRMGDEFRLLTPGDFDVISLLKVDEERGCFYFIASPDNPTQRLLYRGFLDGKPVVRLSPPDARGVHSYQFSSDSLWAIHSSSNADSPGLTELVSIADFRAVRILEDNQQTTDRVSKLRRNRVEFFRVDTGDGVELDAWCITPPGFDPEGSYPLLVHVYGEPAGTTVVDSWGRSSHLWHLMLAQRGYVVMSFDNRGTNVPRGREFRKSVYGKIGILPPKDQAAAVRAVLKSRPYLDAGRVGIWGWSGGGSSSLQTIFKYPEIYTTAIAVAPVPDQRYYDTIYQERYMGLPDANADAFKEGSPINFAEHLKGNLLLIHGTADDNCHYQTVELLIDKLVAHNKQFSLMAYPNRTHAVKERANTERHLRKMMTRFLLEHLPVNSQPENAAIREAD